MLRFAPESLFRRLLLPPLEGLLASSAATWTFAQETPRENFRLTWLVLMSEPLRLTRLVSTPLAPWKKYTWKLPWFHIAFFMSAARYRTLRGAATVALLPSAPISSEPASAGWVHESMRSAAVSSASAAARAARAASGLDAAGLVVMATSLSVMVPCGEWRWRKALAGEDVGLHTR